MAIPFKSFQPSLAPAWLQDPYGQQWFAAHGAVKDALVDRLKQSVKARFPLIAPPDALQLTGNERGIVRGVSESNASYANRVQRAWDSWIYAGTPFGLLSQLFAVGYTSTAIISRGITSTLNASGQLVQVQQKKMVNPYWSVYSVIVPHPWPTSWLSAGNWSAPSHLGAGAGVISAISGIPNPDAGFLIQVSTAGAPGVGAYKVSTDNGITFGAPVTFAASGNILSTGVTFSAAGTFALGDKYFTSQIPPTDSSADANVFRAVIGNWGSKNAKCTAITVLRTGRLIGFPVRTLGASNGIVGVTTTTQWTPPTN